MDKNKTLIPTKKFSENDFIKMLKFVIHNIFVIFDEHAFQQTVVIPMCTNCAPLSVWDRLHTGASQEKTKASQVPLYR
jgi:hypothetical protein